MGSNWSFFSVNLCVLCAFVVKKFYHGEHRGHKDAQRKKTIYAEPQYSPTEPRSEERENNIPQSGDCVKQGNGLPSAGDAIQRVSGGTFFQPLTKLEPSYVLQHHQSFIWQRRNFFFKGQEKTQSLIAYRGTRKPGHALGDVAL